MGSFPNKDRGNNGRFISTPRRDRKRARQIKKTQDAVTNQRVQEMLAARENGTVEELLHERAKRGDTLANLELILIKREREREQGGEPG